MSPPLYPFAAERDRNNPCAPSARKLGATLRTAVILMLAWFAWLNGSARAQMELPQPDPTQPITVTADQANHWKEGSYDVWLLKGHCAITQGPLHAQARSAVLWIEPGGTLGDPPSRMLTYLEGEVVIDYGPSAPTAGPAPERSGRLADKQWFERLYSNKPPDIRVPNPGPEPQVKPAVYKNARRMRDPQGQGSIQRTEYMEFAGPAGRGGVAAQPQPQPVDLPPGTRRIRAFPRSDVPVQAQWFPSADGTEWMAVINSGVNLVIDGLEDYGSIDVSTDRLVIWTTGTQQPNLGGQMQREGTPLEIYMEGNVVFRQGDRIVQAPSMYYDVNQRIGIILNAEMLTPMPKYAGLVRLRASVLRQLDSDHYSGQNTSLTTSRLGEPVYEIRSTDMVFNDTQRPLIDPVTGMPQLDPRTGEPRIDHEERVTGRNDTLYIAGIPVFYWPVFSADLEEGNTYLTKFDLKEDSVFGFQVLTEFDMYQILGIRSPPKGTSWDVSLDYLSLRGPAAGSDVKYDLDHLFGIPGRTVGMYDSWFIDDHGHDDLGADRRDVDPDKTFRGRILAQHHEQLSDDWSVAAELGYITDRNFLEEYFKHEWTNEKDESTDVEFLRLADNTAWTISAAYNFDLFFTQTEWYPRTDHFWLGQPLVNDNFTWFEHSSLGYARQVPADKPPANDPETFNLLPYEARVQGDREATRQEIDWPMQWGPLKVVPFALGELAHWGESLNTSIPNTAAGDLDRAYGIVGFRGSLPFWAVDPSIQSSLFNVNGIAHKVVLTAELDVADSSQPITKLPLYDQIDDDSVQFFRRRFITETFGGMNPVPPKYDERFYAIRRGLGDDVTDPTEIDEDGTVLRLGIDQRWQTKRGPADDQHIIDWIVLDADTEIYPNASQNFGSVLGLSEYDFHWYVGDRLTLVSDGAADSFGGGQRQISIGGFLIRPPRINLYLGFRMLEGPINGDVLTTAISYRMSPKWATTLATTFNVGPGGNIGESMSFTRIGESFLMTAGFNVDATRGSVGASFLLEPRFLPNTRLVHRSGLTLPPSGAGGLE